MRRLPLLVIAVPCLSWIAALAWGKAPATPVREVRVGDILPLTGAFASRGQEYLWAAQTVEDIVNGDHSDLAVPLGPGKGLPKLGGARLTLVVRDDQSRGDRARALAEQLVTVDRVHWLNGDGTSENTAFIQPVAERLGIPLSCHVCTAPSLTEKRLKWFWRTGPNDETMIAAVFAFLREWRTRGGPPDLKTLALLSCDDLFCRDSRSVAADLAAKIGLRLVLDLTAKVGATTFAPDVERLRAARPDVLFLVLYAPETSVFQGDARRAGWMPRVVATNDGAYSNEEWLRAQAKTNGAVDWLGRDPTAPELVRDRPGWRQVNAVYRKYSHGRDMGEPAMRAITGLLWVADTINRAKSIEPAALWRAAMKTDTAPQALIIDYRGIRFDEFHQNDLAVGIVTQIGWDGEKHTIWPWDLAQKANFAIIAPSPSWQERERRLRAAK